MAMLKVACVVVMMCIVVIAVAPGHAEATITCSQVTGSMATCLGYLKNGGQVPGSCCTGVKNLNNLAKTTPDRQRACTCLQSASASIPGIKPTFAIALPGKCGISIPYKISPSTDCSKVK